MKEISKILKDKYLLSNYPTDEQIKDWASKTQTYITNGEEASLAGFRAAKEILKASKTYLNESQTDDILAILQSIKGK